MSEVEQVPQKKGSGRGLMWAGFFTGAIGLLAAAVMAGVLVVSKSSEKKPAPTASANAMTVTPDGFIVEPPSSIGPDAFTPSVVTEDGKGCDKSALVRDLQERPDALSAWAGVLGIAASDVSKYVEGLQPTVLTVDTKVTNHGFRNGSAYARPSVLPAGTQVLIAAEGYEVPPMTPPPSGSPRAPESATPSSTGSATPGSGTPVTRCRCGNPLLPPYSETESTPTATPTPSASPSPSTTQRIARTPTRTPTPSASTTRSSTPSPTKT